MRGRGSFKLQVSSLKEETWMQLICGFAKEIRRVVTNCDHLRVSA
jgi:hypothetical protein